MDHDTQKGAKPATIYVNTQPLQVSKDDESFEQLVELAFPGQTAAENAFFTITYRQGRGEKPEGSLTAGQTVKVKDGMIFNVVRTDKS